MRLRGHSAGCFTFSIFFSCLPNVRFVLLLLLLLHEWEVAWYYVADEKKNQIALGWAFKALLSYQRCVHALRILVRSKWNQILEFDFFFRSIQKTLSPPPIHTIVPSNSVVGYLHKIRLLFAGLDLTCVLLLSAITRRRISFRSCCYFALLLRKADSGFLLVTIYTRLTPSAPSIVVPRS